MVKKRSLRQDDGTDMKDPDPGGLIYRPGGLTLGTVSGLAGKGRAGESKGEREERGGDVGVNFPSSKIGSWGLGMR